MEIKIEAQPTNIHEPIDGLDGAPSLEPTPAETTLELPTVQFGPEQSQVQPTSAPASVDSPWNKKEAYELGTFGAAGDPIGEQQVEPAIPNQEHGLKHHLGRKLAALTVAALATVGISEGSKIIDQFNKPSSSSEYDGSLVPPTPNINVELPTVPSTGTIPAPEKQHATEQASEPTSIKQTETPRTLDEPKPPTKQEVVTPPSSKPEQPPLVTDIGGTDTKPTDGSNPPKVHNPIVIEPGQPPVAPPVESPVTTNPPPLSPGQ